MLSVLFDKELFDKVKITINKKQLFFYIINNNLYEKHINLITKCSTNKLLSIDFID